MLFSNKVQNVEIKVRTSTLFSLATDSFRFWRPVLQVILFLCLLDERVEKEGKREVTC